ncbi:MAG: molybdenum cofactor biosynthesis protein MoaE [Methylomonas sp.]|jgi:molybdopterin synthase catalytic subunit
MTIQLSASAFDPWLAIRAYQQQAMPNGKYGAASVFVGTMRDFNQGDTVRALFLEHYPGMTEKQLETIVAEANQRWAIQDALLMHRIGEVMPDETLVLVAVWSVHRGDAFDACRYIMEALKSRAPFWKKETLASGRQRWVEENSGGYLAGSN